MEQLLAASIAKEAKTKISIWGTQTYGEYFSDSGSLELTKPGFPISSLVHLANKPNKAKERIIAVFENYSRMGFWSKFWWQITHLNESIANYRHLYTILKLMELKKSYASIIQTLVDNPDRPKHSLFTAVFNALILYFNSFLPSHKIFNRLFHKHYELLHIKFDAQFNYLAEIMESGFNFFHNKLNAIENLDKTEKNQLLKEEAKAWLNTLQTNLNKIDDECQGDFKNLADRLGEIKLILECLIHQTHKKNKGHYFHEKRFTKTANSIGYSSGRESTKLLPKDTEEAYNLWLKNILANPLIMEDSLKAMRENTKQISKDARIDLLRYDILSQLSLHWVESIKWQDRSTLVNGISFQMNAKEAAKDAKTNLNLLWAKVFAIHYHPDKNFGADDKTLVELNKIIQSFNATREHYLKLIDEALSSSICPKWIEDDSLEEESNANEHLLMFNKLHEGLDEIKKKDQDLDARLWNLSIRLEENREEGKREIERSKKRDEEIASLKSQILNLQNMASSIINTQQINNLPTQAVISQIESDEPICKL